MKAGGSEVSGHSWLHSLGYRRACRQFSFSSCQEQGPLYALLTCSYNFPQHQVKNLESPRQGSLSVKIRESENQVVWESQGSRTPQGESPMPAIKNGGVPSLCLPAIRRPPYDHSGFRTSVLNILNPK